MRAPIRLLLAELHAHTTWSDGRLATRELVDLYGEHRFDVLCITDHILRSDDPWASHGGSSPGVTPELHASYLAEIEAEAKHYGWKTLLLCERHSAAIVEFLRSGRRAYLGYVSAEADALTA